MLRLLLTSNSDYYWGNRVVLEARSRVTMVIYLTHQIWYFDLSHGIESKVPRQTCTNRVSNRYICTSTWREEP